MAEHFALSLSFLERRPQAAARVLRDIDPDDAAALLERVPVRIAVPTLTYMGVWPGARLLARLSADRAAALLREMPYDEAVVMLRLIDTASRRALLAAMPSSLARAFTHNLAYPPDTVGARMDTDVPLFSASSRAEDCIAYAREHQRSLGGVVVVVDSARRLSGVIAPDALPAAGRRTLSDIADTSVRALTARATLAAVRERADWDHYISLPVVGRGNAVIGVLPRRALADASTQRPAHRPPDADQWLAGHLATAFVVSFAGLLQLTPGLDQSASAQHGRGLSHERRRRTRR